MDARNAERAVNIGPEQRRLRATVGWILLAAAIAVSLAVPQQRLGWAVLVALLSINAAMLVLEARRGICPFTAARGRRNLSARFSMGGGEPIDDPSLRNRLAKQGRRILLDGSLLGLAVTAVLLTLPI